MIASDEEALLRRFRRHPDAAGCWLYREEWPFWGVWEIRGASPVPDDWDPTMFGRHPVTTFDSFGSPLGVALYLFIGWQRRGWLRQHARRANRRLWKRSTPIIVN